jgi:spermidine/putrescine transport system ATP-binding protein
MASPLVVFDNVVKRFGTFEAVKRMNFEIHEGEFLAFMGPSGCGKTTTLRMLAGLEHQQGDRLAASHSSASSHERDTPMVWISGALPFLNARENVEFGLKMRGQDHRRRKKSGLAGRWVLADLPNVT